MKIYLSTLVYTHPGSSPRRLLPWLSKFPDKLGIEIFPMFHEEGYEKELSSCMDELRGVPVSFHEPYHCADHSFAEGTAEYARTMELLKRQIPYMERLDTAYMVFHHNNRDIEPEIKEELKKTAEENFRRTKTLCASHGIGIVVENAGVGKSAMFTDDEFIEECKLLETPVLLDIGHAFANDWDLPKVIKSLDRQIVSYHIHNNDGIHDCHRRIFDGELDFDSFLAMYRAYTPNAHLVLEYCEDVADDESGIEEDVAFLLANA